MSHQLTLLQAGIGTAAGEPCEPEWLPRPTSAASEQLYEEIKSKIIANMKFGDRGWDGTRDSISDIPWLQQPFEERPQSAPPSPYYGSTICIDADFEHLDYSGDTDSTHVSTMALLSAPMAPSSLTSPMGEAVSGAAMAAGTPLALSSQHSGPSNLPAEPSARARGRSRAHNASAMPTPPLSPRPHTASTPNLTVPPISGAAWAPLPPPPQPLPGIPGAPWAPPPPPPQLLPGTQDPYGSQGSIYSFTGPIAPAAGADGSSSAPGGEVQAGKRKREGARRAPRAYHVCGHLMFAGCAAKVGGSRSCTTESLTESQKIGIMQNRKKCYWGCATCTAWQAQRVRQGKGGVVPV